MIEIKTFKVKVELVKCQNEDPKVINEEEYMPKYKCDKLLYKLNRNEGL